MINIIKKNIKKTFDFLHGLYSLITNKQLILIYQMGKVGSQSIEFAIKSSKIMNVVFLHYMFLLKRNKFLEYILLQLYLKSNSPIKIICPIREPVERNISAFSHDFPSLIFENGMTDTPKKMQDFDVQQLEKMFYEVWNRHDLAEKWFDDEFKKITGINIYNYTFNKNNKYLLLEKNNIKVLIFDNYICDTKKSELLSDFLKKKISLNKRVNTAKDKKYKGNYNELKKAVFKNHKYIDKIHSGKFYKHFFIENESNNSNENQ